MNRAAAGTNLRILVSGRIAETPHQGGATWAVLQYLVGLRQLGHEVWFVESVPAARVHPAGTELARSTNARYAGRVLSELDLGGRWGLIAEGTTESVGCDYRSLSEARWDLHINLSGCLRAPELTAAVPIRVYVDLDPAFTQIWDAVDGHDLGLADHTHFATVGCGIGTPGCPVPTGGRNWHHTLPPVVLSHWTMGAEITRDAMTTVAHWRSYGSVEWDGTSYGQRAHSFREFFDLPGATHVALTPALAIDPGEADDLAALTRGGWALVDPAAVAGTPDDYRDFVRSSWGELSIAKSGYVSSRSGWFSDRSACHLASGRPVVAQDTGIGQRLPTGEGLLTFSTCAEAVEALEQVDRDYVLHAAAARRLAVDELDSDAVLGNLLRFAGAGCDSVMRVGVNQERAPDRSEQDLVGAIVRAAIPGATLQRRPSPYSSSHRLEEIEVYGPRDLTLRLMAKHTGRKAMTEAGRQARPVELDGTGRELAVYRDILAGAGLATPALIGGRSGPSRGVLVLERVPGTPLTEVGDFGAWESAARWLARMHVNYEATPRPMAALGPETSLARYDRDLLDAAGRSGLARAAEQRLGSSGARAALARAHEQGLDVLTSTASTLVHGDFYPSNIMVAGERIAVLDWELAGTGPAELDLAALLAGRWGGEQRAALATAYHEEAVAARGVTEPLAALLWRVALASVHLALRWLGSEPEWNAPEEHHRDWFADALAALARLEGCTN